MSADAAEVLELSVGDVIGFVPADALVSGIYEPIDPDDPYWIHESGLADATIEPVTGKPPVARTSAYIDPVSAAGLQEALLFGRLQAWIPVDTGGFDYADAAELQIQVRQIAAAQVSLSDFGNLGFRSGLPEVIDRAISKVTAASSLLALSVSGLLGVLLAVFALGVQSVVARRRPALALASARGAGELQLRGAMVLEGLLLSVPGSAIAVAAAALILPGRVGIEAWVLPAAVALAPPVLFATLTSGRELRSPRSDLRLRARSRSRWIAEVAVVGLAALSLFLLARRGLVESSDSVGIDPLLAATPLLLAAAVCIGVLRLYPLPLLGVQRGLRRRRGAAGVLGAARAIRDPSLGFAAALALVVGITIVVFSTVMATTLRSGLEQAAQESVGADIQVKAQDLGPEVVAAVEGVDGVDSAVSIPVQSASRSTIGTDETKVFVVFADTAALHDMRPDIPRLDAQVDGRIPLVISTDWAERIEDGRSDLGGAPGAPGRRPATRRTARRHPPLGPHRLVVRSQSLDLEEDARGAAADDRADSTTASRSSALAPAVLKAVTELQSEKYRDLVTVTDIETELAIAREAPTVSGLETALMVAAVVSLLLTMLAVVLGSVAAATSRNRTVGVLRILGMSARQLRVLSAWELAPVAITAVVIGTALGLVLPWIVTGVLDLRPFVGGRFPPTPRSIRSGSVPPSPASSWSSWWQEWSRRPSDVASHPQAPSRWEKDEHADSSTAGRRGPPTGPHIQCADLVRIFSAEGVEVQALQGLTLSVERGELTAIVGASGSGKSTLLAILSGLDVPTAGSARVAGHDLLAMTTRERTQYRRHTVGFVWQQTGAQPPALPDRGGEHRHVALGGAQPRAGEGRGGRAARPARHLCDA